MQSSKENKKQWQVSASAMSKNTHNPIRKLVDCMKLTPNPNKEMISLSIGDPTIFGNMKTHEEINSAIVRSLQSYKYNGYAPSVGYVEARAAVAKFLSKPAAPLEAKDVILACGCSGAIEMAICVLANPGDNILIPRPGFSLYKTIAHSVGIECRLYDLLPDKSWEVNLDHMRSLIDSKTAAIVVNSPSNPCGSVYSAQHLRDILAIAEAYKVPIISDEVYADWVFPGEEFVSLASVSTDVPILTCGGLAKRWIVPGWRMGWILINDRNGIFQKEVVGGLVSLSQKILGPNTILQGAMSDIFTNTPQSFYNDGVATMQRHAKICYEALRNVPGLKPIMPRGAMYMMVGIDIHHFPDFVSDFDFTERMVTEQSVFALPCQCFDFPNFFRIVLTVPEEKIVVACERIAEFCRAHYSSRVEEPTIVNVDISNLHVDGGNVIQVRNAVAINGSSD